MNVDIILSSIGRRPSDIRPSDALGNSNTKQSQWRTIGCAYIILHMPNTINGTRARWTGKIQKVYAWIKSSSSILFYFFFGWRIILEFCKTMRTEVIRFLYIAKKYLWETKLTSWTNW